MKGGAAEEMIKCTINPIAETIKGTYNFGDKHKDFICFYYDDKVKLCIMLVSPELDGTLELIKHIEIDYKVNEKNKDDETCIIVDRKRFEMNKGVVTIDKFILPGTFYS